MGTPESELESKYSIKGYFAEGEAHARAGGKRKNFCLMKLFCARAMQLAFCCSHLGY
jgi:hypothetical protein